MSDLAIEPTPTKIFKTSPEQRARVAKALRARKARLKEAGLCQDCSYGKPATGRTLCATCLENRRKRWSMSPSQTTPGIHPTRVVFTIPLTPPSVNHYVLHQGGKHFKSPEAKAWERDFSLFSRQQYVVSQVGRYRAILEYFLAPGESGDVDNFNKCVLDCCAKARMLLDSKLEPKSDAWIKEMQVFIRDTEADRKKGPLTRITIEAL